MKAPAAEMEKFIHTITFYGIGLVIALIVMAFVVHRIRNWYRGSDDPADNQDEIIRQLKESASQGELTDEEFRSIKSRISSQRQDSLRNVASPKSEASIRDEKKTR
ncbi:MAG TPA: hypothetical protein VNQ76_03010 [Planctomicrobium sp.]|nr:hypothetical protein [Planctomicrobium sp.]